MSPEAQIEALCRRLEEAHLARDAEAIAACYAPGAVIYDMAPPLSKRGPDRKTLAAWLAGWEGPLRIDPEEVEMAVSGDLGWSSALTRMRGKRRGEGEVDMWFRSTLCFRQIGGTWLIVHEHSSTPFYMDGSFRAAVDLTPASTDRWDAPAP